MSGEPDSLDERAGTTHGTGDAPPRPDAPPADAPPFAEHPPRSHAAVPPAGTQAPAATPSVPPSDPIRAAEDKVRRERLITLKAEKASGRRPPGLAHGRWLGDFLDQDTKTGLLPAEEKLLAVVTRGEECDLHNRERW
ncbi:MAG: hypothetical protein R3D44_10870 [Hyphomicrobiaceae bacterium]